MNDWTTAASIVAMLGWLVLAFGAYRSRGLGARTSLMHAGLWVLIFATIALIAARFA